MITIMGKDWGPNGVRDHLPACENLEETEEAIRMLASQAWESYKGAECSFRSPRAESGDCRAQGSSLWGSGSWLTLHLFLCTVVLAPAIPIQYVPALTAFTPC